jgi:hypothetical protein
VGRRAPRLGHRRGHRPLWPAGAPPPGPPGQRFENVVLEAFYSPFLAYDRLPLTHLCDLLNDHDPEGWAKADRRPLVKEVLARRLQAWTGAATATPRPPGLRKSWLERDFPLIQPAPAHRAR